MLTTGKESGEKFQELLNLTNEFQLFFLLFTFYSCLRFLIITGLFHKIKSDSFGNPLCVKIVIPRLKNNPALY
jgi:hypothetical protein